MAKSELFEFFSRVNRDPRIGSMCLGFVASLLMAPWLFFAWSDARFIVGGVRTEGRIVSCKGERQRGEHLANVDTGCYSAHRFQRVRVDWHRRNTRTTCSPDPSIG
ncbi:MAG: hypothetical protein U0795_09300 [Pirellulales bacterium]